MTPELRSPRFSIWSRLTSASIPLTICGNIPREYIENLWDYRYTMRVGTTETLNRHHLSHPVDLPLSPVCSATKRMEIRDKEDSVCQKETQNTGSVATRGLDTPYRGYRRSPFGIPTACTRLRNPKSTYVTRRRDERTRGSVKGISYPITSKGPKVGGNLKPFQVRTPTSPSLFLGCISAHRKWTNLIPHHLKPNMTSAAPRTRSNSKTSSTPAPTASAPTLATPADVASTGYPDKPVSKGKTPLSAFHFSKKPVANTYTGSSTTKVKPRTGSSVSSARSSNSFGVLSSLDESTAGNNDDEITLDEQVARELIGADQLDAAFETRGASQDVPSGMATSSASLSSASSPGSIKGTEAVDKGKGKDTTSTRANVMKELARKLAGRPFHTVPVAVITPSTSSVPWSAAVVAAAGNNGAKDPAPATTTGSGTPQSGSSSAFLSPMPPQPVSVSTAPTVPPTPDITGAPTQTPPALPILLATQVPPVVFTRHPASGAGPSSFAAAAAAPAAPSAPATRARTQQAAAAAASTAAQHAAAPMLPITPAAPTIAPAAPAIPPPTPAAPVIAPAAPVVLANTPAAPVVPPAVAAAVGGLVAPAVAPAGAAPAPGQGGLALAAPPPLMPMPVGGFPPVHGWNARNVFTNVSNRTNIAWSGLAGDKIIVYEFDGSHPLVVPPPTPLLLSCTLICPAEPVVDPTHLHEAPFIHVLNNLAQHNLQILLDRRFWSFPDVSFFAMPFPPAMTTFLCTLDGLLFANTQEDAIAVETTVAITIRDEPATQTFLARAHDNYPAGIDPMTYFIGTLRVTAQELSNTGGGTRIACNVTAEPPSSDIDLNNKWIGIINGMVFHTPMHYVGKPIVPPLACGRCMSLGHPSGRCLLPTLPGFNGPQVASTVIAPNVTPAPAQAPAPTNNGPGAGRGRGGNIPRGRGGRGGSRGGRGRARGRGF
ncbi:hypothetical protein C8R43DRAFT_958028 [Mycena crocata]|nr:hypothetical protein C8R43DRAFT_958028 [Mycena crocata]